MESSFTLLALLRREPKRCAALSFFLFALLTLSACTGNKPGVPPGMVGINYPPALSPLATKLATEGHRTWVLNLNEMAVAAMKIGEREIAKRALDQSILEIEAVFGQTPEAEKARNIFFNEDVKLFKGDPYERSMAYFYRGVLYMQDEDFENARACFRGGIRQDGFAEESQNRSDWTIFDYLISVCEVRIGRDFYANESFERAKKNYDQFPSKYRLLGNSSMTLDPAALQPISYDANLLVITQVGAAPQKIRVGNYQQFLGYQRGGYPVGDAHIDLCGHAYNALTLDSLYYQAATRGGRPFDKIQGHKVFFKETGQAIGAGSTLLGMEVLGASGGHSASGEEAVAGVALIAVGAGATAFSELVSTKADIRAWTSLPESIGVCAVEACGGPQTLTVTVPGSGAVYSPANLAFPGNGFAVALVFPGPNPAILISPSAEAVPAPAPAQTPTTSTSQISPQENYQ